MLFRFTLLFLPINTCVFRNLPAEHNNIHNIHSVPKKVYLAEMAKLKIYWQFFFNTYILRSHIHNLINL